MLEIQIFERMSNFVINLFILFSFLACNIRGARILKTWLYSFVNRITFILVLHKITAKCLWNMIIPNGTKSYPLAFNGTLPKDRVVSWYSSGKVPFIKPCMCVSRWSIRLTRSYWSQSSWTTGTD